MGKYVVHAADQMSEEDAMRYSDAAYRFLEKTEDGMHDVLGPFEGERRVLEAFLRELDRRAVGRVRPLARYRGELAPVLIACAAIVRI